VITCGDYENDIPMHRVADVSVAPANAHPDVKALCDHVFCSNDEGVIADIIEGIETGKILPKRK
jgi:hydroxymethylpyrimidine pyrophosphatase-like HAD family hydrolase